MTNVGLSVMEINTDSRVLIAYHFKTVYRNTDWNQFIKIPIEIGIQKYR